MLDYKGRVAESSGSNIFFIKDNVIRTPVPECFLNGITRQTVMKLAAEIGYDIAEAEIMPEEIGDYQEVFVTGTAAEITPVGRIDDHKYTPGKITETLQEAYRALTRGEQQARKMA